MLKIIVSKPDECPFRNGCFDLCELIGQMDFECKEEFPEGCPIIDGVEVKSQ